jgi:hypothetical protein
MVIRYDLIGPIRKREITRRDHLITHFTRSPSEIQLSRGMCMCIPLLLLPLFLNFFPLHNESQLILTQFSAPVRLFASLCQPQVAHILGHFLMPITSKVICIRFSFPSSLDKLFVLSVPARVLTVCLFSGANMTCVRPWTELNSKHQYSKTHEGS